MDLLAGLGRTLGFSFAAGINLYATVALLGLASRFGWVELPPQYKAFDHDWVIYSALALYVVEFLADKIPWVDTIWDTLHTFIRPIGGALIAVTTLGDASPTVTALTALLGGVVAGSTHVTKAGTRVVANASPEPFTNWLLSLGEDVFVVGLGCWRSSTRWSRWCGGRAARAHRAVRGRHRARLQTAVPAPSSLCVERDGRVARCLRPRRLAGDLGPVRTPAAAAAPGPGACRPGSAAPGTAPDLSAARRTSSALMSSPRRRRAGGRPQGGGLRGLRGRRSAESRDVRTGEDPDRRRHGHARGARTVRESREMVADPRARVFVLFLDTYHVGQGSAVNVRRPLVNMLKPAGGARRPHCADDAGHGGQRRHLHEADRPDCGSDRTHGFWASAASSSRRTRSTRCTRSATRRSRARTGRRP